MHLLDVCLIKLVSAIRFGLGIIHDVFNFCTSHGHASFMHTFFLFLFYSELVLCFLLFYSVLFCSVLSLSLSDRTSLWHPNRENPLQLGTLFVVPSHPLIILLFHLIFGFMMRRPRWTSLRTSRTVAFIQNTGSFCRISPSLRYPMSFELGDGNLSVRNLCVVPPCLLKSFTPTYTALIPLCLSLFLHFEVHVSWLLRILYLMYYTSLGKCILTTLAVHISGPCLETTSSLTFVRLLPYRVVS